jgi:hypothetical protein
MTIPGPVDPDAGGRIDAVTGAVTGAVVGAVTGSGTVHVTSAVSVSPSLKHSGPWETVAGARAALRVAFLVPSSRVPLAQLPEFRKA